MSLLNKKMEVYFGSNRIVNQPKIITDGYYKDFGYGFYCTNFEKQAKRWAFEYSTHSEPHRPALRATRSIM